MAKVGMDIMNFQPPMVQSAVEYPQALWTEALHGRRVYDKYYLNGTLIEGLRHSIQQRRSPSYCPKNRSVLLQEIARHPLSNDNLQSENATPESRE